MDFLWSAERDRVKVTLRCELQGGDGMLWLYGGDRPHLGAAAVWSRDTGLKVTAFPGHREGVVVEETAGRLAAAGELDSFVLGCGIHLDQIKPEEIAVVLALCRELTDRLIETLKGRGER